MRFPIPDRNPCQRRWPGAHSGWDQRSEVGFTLIELMITIMIVGILSGISLVSLSRRWQSERLQTTSKTMASWLDERRRQGMAAMEQTGIGACSIEINTGSATLSATNSLIRPATLAEPAPPSNICQNQTPLDLRKVVANTNSLTLSVEPASTTRVLFTFRGTSPFDTTPLNTSDFTEFKLRLEDYPDARCVRISKPLGLIRLGVARPASASCSYISAY